jgi:hypothetical protein
MLRYVFGRVGRLLVLAVVLALVASAALITAPRSTFAAQQEITYVGRMTTQVALTDVYGRSAGTQTYQTNVAIIFGYPRQAGLRETNPFSIVIQSTPLVNNPGELSLYSSMVFDNTLFQYWSYQWDGTTFSGSLTNNHVSEAAALNLITVPTEIYPGFWMPYTQGLANGTQMVGTFDQQGNLSIRIVGNITNGAAPFVTDIVASRV